MQTTNEAARVRDMTLSSNEGSHQMIAEPTTILRGLVGSTVHGLVLSGKDDRDEIWGISSQNVRSWKCGSAPYCIPRRCR